MKKKFNLDQKKAVTFANGPCLVVSGPGSGKTYVLTNRILYLIAKYKVDPQNILVITFTRASACEMKKRFEALLLEYGIEISNKPHFGTFHSIFYEILRNDFGYTKDSLITKEESIEYVRKVLTQNVGIGFDNNKLNKILIDINAYKLAKDREESYIPDSIDEKTFEKVYEVYAKELYNNRKLDFFDMIYKCSSLLSSDKNKLVKYQNLFKYILIDEFQDINRSQYNLIKMICKTRNVFVVGDDDQSIYSFRGSKPDVMKSFLCDYSDASIIHLDINYRSKKNIVTFSKRLINANKKRIYKDLKSNDIEDGQIVIKKFNDSRDEDYYIVKEIERYKSLGIPYSEMAILYRTNLLSHSIVRDFKNRSIPYKIKDELDIHGDKDISEKEEKVSLMTFHLSKGLEYKVVFIIDANDGIMPHKKSIRSFDVESERRLFYVAMTRAKVSLHILFTIRRFGKNYKASRFIFEAIGG